jgi:hypothetical protein
MQNIAPINEQTFDHSQTDFALRDIHADSKKVECKACHKPKVKYRDAPSDCYGCHKKDDKHKGAVEQACADCHTERQWKEVRFDHDKTRYTLRHKHVAVPCKDCHQNDRYKNTPMECYACHKKDDKHRGQEGTKCETCHDDRSWKGTSFDHNKSRFPLVGKHVRVECKACHVTPAFKDAPSDCYGCHKKDDKHKGQEGTKCEDCHDDRSWTKAVFDHNKSRFPLHGKHTKIECKKCHLTPAFKDAPMECYGCHKKDDKHKGLFGETCGTCHGENDWKTITFSHDLHTKYPLRGKHSTTTCESCHKGHLYKDNTPTNCNDCHRKDDKHKGRFSEACERCHTERDWKALLFNHDRDTTYPLKGLHHKANCDGCHTGVLYKDKTPTNCNACHKKDDKHTGRFSEACERCHAEQDWKTLRFEHDRDTQYPLLGKHRVVSCQSCHKGTLYKDKTPIDCYSCHQGDDVHRRKLGSQCEDCHNTRDWKIWDFNHDTRTRFKLDGGHKGLGCYECHNTPMGKQVILSSACLVCHKKDDTHRGVFGPQCERCHMTSNWRALKQGSGGFRLR